TSKNPVDLQAIDFGICEDPPRDQSFLGTDDCLEMLAIGEPRKGVRRGRLFADSRRCGHGFLRLGRCTLLLAGNNASFSTLMILTAACSAASASPAAIASTKAAW